MSLESLRLQDFSRADHLEELDVSNNKLTKIPAMIFITAPEIT